MPRPLCTVYLRCSPTKRWLASGRITNEGLNQHATDQHKVSCFPLLNHQRGVGEHPEYCSICPMDVTIQLATVIFVVLSTLKRCGGVARLSPATRLSFRTISENDCPPLKLTMIADSVCQGFGARDPAAASSGDNERF